MIEPISELCQSLPTGSLITDPDLLMSYAHDEAARAAYEIPAAVARPRKASEVVTIVKFCAERAIPVVPRGAGTGVSGGANALRGSIVVSLEFMDRILNIDANERLAVVQPGVTNSNLQKACAEHGLWYPPDPASAPWCTIGGNVSTNAGGICCVKYGVTRDYVLGMQVVVGRGELVRLGRRTAKSAAGYDLAGLFVGSGGTLGIITEITLRLRSARPAERTVVGYFDHVRTAGEAAAAVWSSGVVPSALELVDRYCLQAVDQWKNMGLLDAGNVLLLARTDAPGQIGEAEADRLLQCFDKAGAKWSARSCDEFEAEALFAARRLVYPALQRLGTVLTEDICVPRMRVPQMLERIERIAADHRIYIANLAHIGDGNMHPMVVIPNDDSSIGERAHSAFEKIIDEAIAIGGTVTGEHGVGLLKMRGLAAEVGSVVLDMHRAIKTALDPAGIFNPTKIFE